MAGRPKILKSMKPRLHRRKKLQVENVDLMILADEPDPVKGNGRNDKKIFYIANSSKGIKILRQRQVIESLERNMGMLTYTAKELRCSYSVLKKYVEKNKGVAEALKAIEEESLDLAESGLMTLIKRCNPAALFFYLKTKGKRRGYVENDFQPVPTAPIVFKYVQVTNNPGQPQIERPMEQPKLALTYDLKKGACDED